MSYKTSWRLAAPAFALVILLGACGSSDELGGKLVKDGVGCQPEELEPEFGDVPEIKAVAKVGKDLEQKDVVEGKGCATDSATFLTLDLVGASASDAKVFVDTFADKRPVTATLGSGELIAGLDAGLAGMKVGGRRQIIVPADQAYGKDGNEAQGIGPDEALVFVADLVAVTNARLYCAAATDIPKGREGVDKPTEVDMPLKAPMGDVTTTDLTEGKGEPVEESDTVTVNYLGISCASGQQFDTSWDEGKEPFPVDLGGQGTIPGFTQGILGMKVGGRRQIDIPSALAYGPEGQPPAIGPDDPLVFIIEVLEAEKTPTSTTPAVPPSLPGAPTTAAPGDATSAPSGESTEPADEGATSTTGAPATTEAPNDATTTTSP